MTITLADQIACVRREIAMRERAYPKFIAGGRMTPQRAAAEIAAMKEVLRTLERDDGIGDAKLAQLAPLAPVAPTPGFSQASTRPWSLEWSRTSSASGAFHLYLIEEATSRKIGAIWGGADEKVDTAALIVAAVNAYEIPDGELAKPEAVADD